MRASLKIVIIILLLGSINASAVYAQGTSSPYSIFGLGFLEGKSAGPNRAMGGTGIAFLSGKSVNYMNPASYAGIDSLLSVFEAGLYARYNTYATTRQKQSLFNANLMYILMGFRVTPWLVTSFGLTPYSSIGYDINTIATIEGTNLLYDRSFSGEGGVNQAFLGASIEPVKNLSLGFNGSYLFGNITHSESSKTYEYYLEDLTYVSNFDFNYGLNYNLTFNKNRVSLGLIYGSSKKLKTENITTITAASSSETLKKRLYKYNIPRNIGVGIAFSREFFSVGFDYEKSYWQDIRFHNAYVHTRNSDRYSMGIEFTSKGLSRGTPGMILYRVGGEYRGAYASIDNTPINYKALTLGAGIPLNSWISVVNVSLEIGQNGTTRNGLIRENIYSLHLDLALKDLWFRQRRYN